MTAVATFTTISWRLTQDSTVTVIEDGTEVAHAVVPERGHSGTRKESDRELSILMDLGWQVAGHVGQLREFPDRIELDVRRNR